MHFVLFGWLTGCVGFNGLCVSMSVYVGPSARIRGKEMINDIREKKISKLTPLAPTPSIVHVGLCPANIHISKTPHTECPIAKFEKENCVSKLI